MSDWILNLPVLWMSVVILAAIYVATAGIYLLAPAASVAIGQTPWRDTWAASSATLAFFVVSYADLIAARHLLPGTGSAEYAVLSVLTKGAIWAPSVITTLAVPFFARDVRRELIRDEGVEVEHILAEVLVPFGRRQDAFLRIRGIDGARRIASCNPCCQNEASQRATATNHALRPP